MKFLQVNGKQLTVLVDDDEEVEEVDVDEVEDVEVTMGPLDLGKRVHSRGLQDTSTSTRGLLLLLGSCRRASAGDAARILIMRLTLA
jgi:hypothetical protein